MSRKETYKYYIKAKLDRETDEYTIDLKVKGDYFESLMFAVEVITRSCIEDLGLNKKDFIEHMKNTYDIIKEDLDNDNK